MDVQISGNYITGTRRDRRKCDPFSRITGEASSIRRSFATGVAGESTLGTEVARMSHEKDIESRRRFLKAAAGTAAAAVVIGGLPRMARAADLPHLAETDATAKALGYV